MTGRLDAVLIAARVAPLTRTSGWSRPSSSPTPSRSTSPRRSRPSTTPARAGPASGSGSRQPARGRAVRPARSRADLATVTRRRQLTACWRRGGRLRRGRSGGCGTAGRTTRRSATPPPAGSSTASKLHYIDFAGELFQRQGPVDHAPAAAGPADRVRARARERVPYQLIARSADVGFVTPGRRRARRGDRGRDPRGRTADPVHVLRRPGRVPRRHSRGGRRPSARRGWTSGRATPTPATRPSSPARPRSWPTCCSTGSERACPASGCARAPSPTTSRRSPGQLVPELQRRGAFRTGYEAGHAARAARPRPPRQPVRHR